MILKNIYLNTEIWSQHLGYQQGNLSLTLSLSLSLSVSLTDVESQLKDIGIQTIEGLQRTTQRVRFNHHHITTSQSHPTKHTETSLRERIQRRQSKQDSIRRFERVQSFELSDCKHSIDMSNRDDSYHNWSKGVGQTFERWCGDRIDSGGVW